MILLMLLLNFFAAAHFSCILPCFVFQSHALLLLLLRLRIFPVVFPYILSSSSSSSSLSSLCPSIFNFTSISLSLFRVIREQNVKRMMICCVMISLKACLSCFARSHIYLLFSFVIIVVVLFIRSFTFFVSFTRPSLLCLVLHTTYTFIKDSPSLPPHFAKNLIVHVIVYFSAMNKDAGHFFALHQFPKFSKSIYYILLNIILHQYFGVFENKNRPT